jgi:hypothetical protein
MQRGNIAENDSKHTLMALTSIYGKMTKDMHFLKKNFAKEKIN